MEGLVEKIPKGTDLETLIFCIMYRYDYLGLLTNIMLSVEPAYYLELEKKFGACIELFGSALNHTLPHYCSLFYDLEKFFGSRGNHYNLVPVRGFYLMNPPFTEEVMNSSLERMLGFLDEDVSGDIKYFVTMPIWDIAGRKWVNKHCKIKVKIEYGDMPIVAKMMKSPKLKWFKRYCKEDYKYYDFLTGRFINAAPCYVFFFM